MGLTEGLATRLNDIVGAGLMEEEGTIEEEGEEIWLGEGLSERDGAGVGTGVREAELLIAGEGLRLSVGDGVCVRVALDEELPVDVTE